MPAGYALIWDKISLFFDIFFDIFYIIETHFTFTRDIYSLESVEQVNYFLY